MLIPGPFFRRGLLKWPVFGALGFLILTQPGPAAPVISEFLANNRTTLDDEDGESSDWIEIYNPDNVPVNLSSYILGDDQANPRKWLIPSGTVLAPNQRLLIFASGKNRSTGPNFHTNFQLAASGGSVILSKPTGEVVSQHLNYPKQSRDVSYGLGTNGDTGYFSPPTPESSNGPALSGFVADTAFSVKRGFHENILLVEITSATPGASVRYTSDGSVPTPTRGTLYTGPFIVTSTSVIRAMAFKTGMVPTNVDAQSYLFKTDIVNQSEMNRAITTSSLYRNELLDALSDLPVVSLSFERDEVLGPGGIYENPELKGRSSEREIHFEYFDPANPNDSTHEPAGLRIHGGNSRLHPKKPLRIYFRDDYGNQRLEHDLFPESRVKSFKTLLLRGGGHDAWTFDSRWDEATFIRNQFLHKLQRDMGQPSPFGRHVNVFLNGEYWGLYELQEFPHEHYNADHHGGDPDDWDVVKHGQEVEAGSRKAWDTMITLARNGINSTAEYEAIQEFLDLENFADAMIQRIWSSDEDWLSPFFNGGVDVSTFEDDKNWYVGRKSRNGTTKFYFYSWDAEMSMGVPFARFRTFENDFSQIANDNSPGIIYDALRRFPEFQLYFADRLQRHLFNGGALTISRLQESWKGLTDLVRTPVVAESARWGIQIWAEPDRFSPFTRNNEWLPAVNWVRDQFIPNRSDVILAQFKDVNLYPEVEATESSPPGGTYSSAVNVTLDSPTNNSTIYYTTDGSDPRLPGMANSIPLITPTSEVKAIVPTASINAAIGSTWRNPSDPSNINNWITGENGVGFEEGSGYGSYISVPLNNMFDMNSSAYIRITFEIPDQDTLDSMRRLTLGMRYDDGFAAYLNGFTIASANFGGAIWNGTSSTTHSDTDAIVFENFDVSSHINRLQLGTNVLAIHGQNHSNRSSDFLIEAILNGQTGADGNPSGSAKVYSGPFELAQSTVVKSRTLSDSGQWSALTETYYSIAVPAAADNFTISELHYHPEDASTAAETAVSTNKDDYEFIEFLNTSTNEIDFSGFLFDRGLTFTFPLGSALAPGSRGVIVSNRQAFLARYGHELESVILGEFEKDSNLSNGGETLALRDPEGALVFSFAYDDKFPWQTDPDGGGPSLVLRDPSTRVSALETAGNWRSAFVVHGAPGRPDDMSFELWARKIYGPIDGPQTQPGTIVPGQENSNLLLYAQGTDLNDRPPWSVSTIEENGNSFSAFTYQVRTSLSDVILVPELSSDLITWERSTVVVGSDQRPDGTTLITIRSPETTTGSQAKQFLRLAATSSP